MAKTFRSYFEAAVAQAQTNPAMEGVKITDPATLEFFQALTAIAEEAKKDALIDSYSVSKKGYAHVLRIDGALSNQRTWNNKGALALRNTVGDFNLKVSRSFNQIKITTGAGGYNDLLRSGLVFQLFPAMTYKASAHSCAINLDEKANLLGSDAELNAYLMAFTKLLAVSKPTFVAELQNQKTSQNAPSAP